MKMNEKIEIMLSRKRIRKTDFAHSVGVTYRAFANYMNGTRKPRADTLNKIAEQLQLTPEFLKDDKQELELTIEERFIKKVCASDADKAQAAQFLAQSRGLFAGNALNEDDKEALFRCLWDIYEDSRRNHGKSDK
ncbi:dNA-binding helix-turn-helix protein [Eubacterium sp. CAG:786]|nr:dNA-binding helix-turn-helix protein [Eubacterium sp. CAG:786]